MRPGPHFAAGISAAPSYILSMTEERPRDSMPERPSAEPEVLPPENNTARWRGRGPGVFVFIDRLGHTDRKSVV